MRYFSFRPSFTFSGRKFHGLRGMAGKPLHPPLTDIPIAAYLFVAIFDILSIALVGSHPAVARQLYVAGVWLMLGGVGVSVFAALTGLADRQLSSEAGTQARRTINAHALTMVIVTCLAIADLVLRGLPYSDNSSAPIVVVVLSILAALLVSAGSTLGGTLVYDYGFNVETAGDSPVWHQSQVDVLPGHKETVPAQPASADPIADADPIAGDARS